MKHHYCGYHKTHPTVISLCMCEIEGRKEIIERETEGERKHHFHLYIHSSLEIEC
jgi:hypothetical protein